MALTSDEREILRPRDGCGFCVGLVWCPTCEDHLDELAAAMDVVVARHVAAALTEAAGRVRRAGHGDEPLNQFARAAYGTDHYEDAARIVRDLIPTASPPP